MYKNAKNRKLIWCYLAVVKRGAKVIDLEKHFTISGTIAKNFIHFTWLTSNSLYILTSSENRRKSTNNKYFVEILRLGACENDVSLTSVKQKITIPNETIDVSIGLSFFVV